MRSMHGLMAVGCAAGALLAAGCGGSDSAGGGTSAGATSTTAAAEAKLVDALPAATGPVDTVTWALPTGEPSSLDPMKSGDESGATVLGNLCESILSVK